MVCGCCVSIISAPATLTESTASPINSIPLSMMSARQSIFLKTETGIEHVTLCGFRVGAALALAAASRRPVDDLVVLAPAASGRTYMRELSVVRKTWIDQLPAPLREAQQKEGPLNVLGQIYHDDFKRALESVDFFVRSLKEAGKAAARRALIIPRAAFAQAADWMAGESKEGVPVVPGELLTTEWPELRIGTEAAIERPVCLGEEKLFGILYEPRKGTVRGQSVFLLTNTSANSRVGDSRLSVRIARELARRGIASLRFDAHGRGDSAASPGALQDTPYGRIYNLLATEDTAMAARWLSQRGYKSIFSFSICSGAYHALKAVVIEPSVTGVVSVNVPTFKKPEDKTPEAVRQQTRNSMRSSRRSGWRCYVARRICCAWPASSAVI